MDVLVDATDLTLFPCRNWIAMTQVLLVDCDVSVVNALSDALRGNGYDPLGAITFEDAMSLWTAHMPPIIVANVRLGAFNGLHLLVFAKNDRPDVRCVITCDIRDIFLEAEAYRLGAVLVVRRRSIEAILDALAST